MRLRLASIVVCTLATLTSVGGEPPAIRVVEGGWGGAPVDNIQALLHSVATVFYTNVAESAWAPLQVAHGDESPIALYGRSAAGEVRIRLNASDTYWAQYVYQFAHEVGHVLAHYERKTEARPHGWFEETLCETASLFALRQLAQRWVHHPPYPNWASFAPRLQDYANELLQNPARRLPPGQSLSDWYTTNAAVLQTNATDRTRNAVVAAELLPCFEANPSGWSAVGYLNDGPAATDWPTHLRTWRERVPAEQRAVVDAILQRFGVAP